MLTLSPIQSIDYYADLAADDYYHAGGEPPGRWAGRGTALLGLQGTVDTEAYRNILRGYDPEGREALCRKAGDKHRAGWDLTFSAPKSVSVLWARADIDLRHQIQASHQAAVLAALDHIEQHAAITRRGYNGCEREAVAGLIIATFEHSTSREQDPQLHTHSLVANLAPRSDGSWGTLESRDLYLWQRSAGAIYRAELAHRLQGLGFGIEADGDAFQVKGVPKAACQHFSKRTLAIEKTLEQYGSQSSASSIGDMVTLATRSKKAAIDRPVLFQEWQADLDGLGFGVEQLEALQQFETPLQSLDAETVLEQLTAKMAVFRAQDVYKISAQIAQTSGHSAREAERVARRILADQRTIDLGRDRRHSALFTTQELVEAEQQMVACAKSLRQQSGFAVAGKAVLAAIESKPFRLSDEQRQAVMDVCQSHGFAILQGSAGAGKSASMDCVRASYEAEGYEVMGAAIAKSAADNLAVEAQLNTMTISRLLQAIERDKSPLHSKSVLIIDEAGQVGTPQLAALLEAAQQSGSKIVLVGEDKQLDAIERGGCLRYLSRPEVLGTSRIETIMRQRTEGARQAVADLRDGKALLALQEYQRQKQITFGADADAAKADLGKSWEDYQQQNPGKQSLVLAQRWADVKDLNAGIRERLQSQNQVGQQNIELDCAIGDHVMKYEFSEGERVRFTRNDYRRGLTNGTLGTLLKVERLGDDVRFVVRTDDQRQVSFLASEYSNDLNQVYLAQAYALTVYSSQGLTIDGDVFVLYSSGMDRAHSYVAGSRHKDSCRWFVNAKEIDELTGLLDRDQQPSDAQRLEALADRMSEDRYQALALEHLSEEQRQQLSQEREPKSEFDMGWALA